MFIPNPDSNNIYVFDDVANFGDAVERFARGANVFWKSGTTYDMLTSYENGKLVGAKYTVDENGASETPGGGGGAAGLVLHEVQDTSGTHLDKTYAEILSVASAGGCVVLDKADTYKTLVIIGGYSVSFFGGFGMDTYTVTSADDYPTAGGDTN